jgi:hypothetical protein
MALITLRLPAICQSIFRSFLHSSVRFHPETPLVSFLGPVRPWVALFLLFLGGGRRGNQRGVHQRPFA